MPITRTMASVAELEERMNKQDEFYIAHFEGIDRSLEEIRQQIAILVSAQAKPSLSASSEDGSKAEDRSLDSAAARRAERGKAAATDGAEPSTILTRPQQAFPKTAAQHFTPSAPTSFPQQWNAGPVYASPTYGSAYVDPYLAQPLSLGPIPPRLQEVGPNATENGRAFPHNRPPEPRVYDSTILRLDMPISDGSDICGWIHKAERYFLFNGLSEPERLSAPSLCLDGKALTWFQWREEQRSFNCWAELRDALLERFEE